MRRNHGREPTGLLLRVWSSNQAAPCNKYARAPCIGKSPGASTLPAGSSRSRRSSTTQFRSSLTCQGWDSVDVPEDEYARLYEKLSSSDSALVEEAMSSLRRIKALEEAEVEAHERGPERTGAGDIQDLSGRISKDLSEPIFFHSRGQPRSRRLY